MQLPQGVWGTDSRDGIKCISDKNYFFILESIILIYFKKLYSEGITDIINIRGNTF